MAITRSQIARQLLAEGGAPRKGFARGSTGFEGSPEMGGRGTTESYGFDQSNGGDNEPVRTEDVFPKLNEVTARDVFKASASNPLLYRSGVERAALASFPVFGPLITAGEQFAYDLPMFQYSRTGPNFKDRFVDDGDDNDTNRIIRKPIMPTQPTQPTQAEKEFAVRFFLPEEYRLADGGDVRQNYGLGKLVKKATRAVKKVVKSPVGKAAVAGYFLGGGNLGGILSSRPGFSMANLGSALGFGRLSAGPIADEGMIFRGGPFSGFANLVRDRFTSTGTGLPTKALLGIGGASILAGMTAPKEEEQESLSQKIADRTGIDIAAIRKEVQDAYAAGDISGLRTKYPFLIPTRAAAAEGGMMDLGGNEMDLRGGGFVPIGKKEKADDVPARLSKNEFVFTADAVRAAGGGSVDRGADLMYKTMKQLENKVA